MDKRLSFLLVINMAILIGLFTRDPIIQNDAYHGFIDSRSIMGHKNFFDCFSNIFFLFVSFIGLKFCARNYLRLSWKLFFMSVGLVAFGSYYYHHTPNNQTLVWDRLPMTLAFMSLVHAVFYDTFKLKAEKKSLFMLLALGVASVIVWVTTGDLRLYYWVQITPIISLLIIGLFFSRHLNAKFMIGAFCLYVLAKYTEHNDALFYNFIGLSGHTIKHILAAASTYCLYLMKKKPRTINGL